MFSPATSLGGSEGAAWQEQEAGTVYFTLSHMAAAHRIQEQNRETLLMQGELWGLWPPERAYTYDSKTWRCASGVALDLVNETTRGTWKEKLKTF